MNLSKIKSAFHSCVRTFESQYAFFAYVEQYINFPAAELGL